MAQCVVFAACAPDSPGRVDRDAVRDSLMEIDRAFGQATADAGVADWAEYIAEDGVWVQPGIGEIRGPEQIQRAMGPFFEAGGRLLWVPQRAEVGGAGDLGYTFGTYEAEAPSSDGAALSVDRGVYVTVWRRDDQGRWRAVLDMGTPANPASPAPGGAAQEGPR